MVALVRSSWCSATSRWLLVSLCRFFFFRSSRLFAFIDFLWYSGEKKEERSAKRIATRKSRNTTSLISRCANPAAFLKQSSESGRECQSYIACEQLDQRARFRLFVLSIGGKTRARKRAICGLPRTVSLPRRCCSRSFFRVVGTRPFLCLCLFFFCFLLSFVRSRLYFVSLLKKLFVGENRSFDCSVSKGEERQIGRKEGVKKKRGEKEPPSTQTPKGKDEPRRSQWICHGY